MSELDNVAPGGIVQLDNAPAGLDDATFDSLFPVDGPSKEVTQPQSAQPTGTNASTQTVNKDGQPSNDTFFLKGDKTVYKSAEEAVRGLNQKDTLIEQLRQRYALTTGIDPITGQPIAQAIVKGNPDNYVENPNRYIEDLANASKKDPSAVASVQQKFVMDSLAPLQPIIEVAVQTNALKTLAAENADAAKFVDTPLYQKTLEANPELGGAIAAAKSDPRFHSRLPGLYKLAYLTGQGMQLPELLAAATPQKQTTQVRTGIQPSTLAPPTESAAKPNMNSIQGIRATIAAMEAKGIKLDF